MKLPWRVRAHREERHAEAAEERLRKAPRDLARSRRVIAESKQLKHTNGFAEAIRTAYGVAEAEQ